MPKRGIPSEVQKFRDLRECAQIGIDLAKAGRRNMWDAGRKLVHRCACAIRCHRHLPARHDARVGGL